MKPDGHDNSLLPPAAPVWVRPLAIIIAALLLANAIAIGLGGQNDLAQAVGPGKAWAISIGKTLGLVAITLLMLQFALSSRLKLLDRAFGLDRLLGLHRYTGATAGVLVLIHPLLIYGAKTDLYTIGALRWELWPVAMGSIALALLVIVVCTSLWRAFILMPYETWRRVHLLVFVVVVAANVHAMVLGSDFARAWVKFTWWPVVFAYAALFVWVKIVKAASLRRRRFTVTGIEPLNYNVCRITLAAPDGVNFRHYPGQFAFLTLHGQGIKAEEHPFTISSPPGRGGTLTFTIKASGDFTKTVPNTKPSDKATVDGPYGRFSHVIRSRPGEALLLVAGGVGITPLLSMLRRLRNSEPGRHVTLIWFNRKQRDIFARDELEQMKQGMPELSVHHVLSEEPDWDGETGLLEVRTLVRLLDESDRAARVFLCGPPPMMTSATSKLRTFGIPRGMIHTERFAL